MEILKRSLLTPFYITGWLIGGTLLTIWGILTILFIPVLLTWIITGDTDWWTDIPLMILIILCEHTFKTDNNERKDYICR